MLVPLRRLDLISAAIESLPLDGLLSWDFTALQSLGHRRRARLLVTEHPDLGPRGSAPDFLTCAVAGPRLSPATSSPELVFPSEYDRDQVAGTVMEPATSPEVRALSALEGAGVHDPGVPRPGWFRLQGFTPSWRFTPHRPVRAFFIPVALLGFSPFEASLSEIAPPRRRSLYPHAVGFRPGFRVLIPPRVRHQPGRG